MNQVFSITILLCIISLSFPDIVRAAPWYQTIGGDVHSTGTIRMSSASIATNPYFSKIDTRSMSGIVTYQSGGSPSSYLGGSESNETWTRARALSINSLTSTILGKYTRDYYFNRLTNTSTGNVNGSSICEYTTPPRPSGVYRINPSTNNIDCSIIIPSSSWYIYVANGNITVKNKVVVPNDSFFMIANNNTIAFDVSSGGSLSNPDIQGVYIARNISTSTGGTPFFAEGVFLAHNSFTFGRNAGDGVASETFTYNPSYLLRAPKVLWETVGGYQEVAP